MAEGIGVASGVLTLAICAFNASTTLYNTIASFRSHNQRVIDLQQELEALNAVLESLNQTIEATDVDLSPLDLPLRRCGDACKEFEEELVKCSSRSTSARASFRDWAKLKYMGEDIDGFRRLLASYKVTINIALTHASLRKSKHAAESLEAYRNLIDTAHENLQDHLKNIDAKLNDVIGRSVPETGTSMRDLEVIKKERSSALRCLQICEQLSQQIEHMQLTTEDDGDESATATATHSKHSSQKIAREGLAACRENLTLTAARLESYMQDLTRQIVQKSKNVTASDEDAIALERLYQEWEATRQSIGFCSAAEKHLKENVSSIENHGTGDSVQFMVSTNGQVIHGKNHGMGWRNRQVGGHLSDAAVLQLSKDMSTVNVRTGGPEPPSSRSTASVSPDHVDESTTQSNFDNRHGRGFTLSLKDRSELPQPVPATQNVRKGSSRS